MCHCVRMEGIHTNSLNITTLKMTNNKKSCESAEDVVQHELNNSNSLGLEWLEDRWCRRGELGWMDWHWLRINDYH